MRHLTTLLIGFSVIGTGAMAGIYFIFSAVIMGSLSRQNPGVAIAVMNAINVDIVRSAFAVLFVATTLASLILAVIALRGMDAAGATPLLAAGAIYVIGMFGVTALFNVPLNNALISPTALPDPAAAWRHYAPGWVMWNTVRAAASITASPLYLWALCVRPS